MAGPADNWNAEWDAYHEKAANDSIRMPDVSRTKPSGNGHVGMGSPGCGTTLASLLVSVWTGVAVAFLVLGVLGR